MPVYAFLATGIPFMAFQKQLTGKGLLWGATCFGLLALYEVFSVPRREAAA
jgi:hypothetical protein